MVAGNWPGIIRPSPWCCSALAWPLQLDLRVLPEWKQLLRSLTSNKDNLGPWWINIKKKNHVWTQTITWTLFKQKRSNIPQSWLMWMTTALLTTVLACFIPPALWIRLIEMWNHRFTTASWRHPIKSKTLLPSTLPPITSLNPLRSPLLLRPLILLHGVLSPLLQWTINSTCLNIGVFLVVFSWWILTLLIKEPTLHVVVLSL